ncbi:secernin-2-like [Limulus polyphemus]|uniref:Secernin-2-like n=1 Tax=Limulus polyphemus TaxID=6850 RepID=A0ABM1T5D9_LIMPO|nr:secernin-2-like [Limulus polyphemus]
MKREHKFEIGKSDSSSIMGSFVHSCDTFVALPPATANGFVVFGKNSDRPSEEVQEVLYVKATDHPAGSKLQCTYIEIDQAEHTHAVILSKPAWMWGAEMGSNEHGVCIGNEAVWTKLNGPQDHEEKLLGMDLLRLGLERAITARKALDVITELLEKHGQGGPCSDIIPSMTYHNSFIIADQREAWVLETVDRFWAAEHVTCGVRNISNHLSIGKKIDLMSKNLEENAFQKGLWDPSKGGLDFARAFGEGATDRRYKCGRKLLTELSASGGFREKDMFTILRDVDSGICMSSGFFVSTGSQVSVLTPPDTHLPCCHWFTATPNPRNSMFKPFIFCPDPVISEDITSPTFPLSEDPAKNDIDKLEAEYVEMVEKLLSGISPENSIKVKDILKKAVDSEIRIYSSFLEM